MGFALLDKQFITIPIISIISISFFLYFTFKNLKVLYWTLSLIFFLFFIFLYFLIFNLVKSLVELTIINQIYLGITSAFPSIVFLYIYFKTSIHIRKLLLEISIIKINRYHYIYAFTASGIFITFYAFFVFLSYHIIQNLFSITESESSTKLNMYSNLSHSGMNVFMIFYICLFVIFIAFFLSTCLKFNYTYFIYYSAFSLEQSSNIFWTVLSSILYGILFQFKFISIECLKSISDCFNPFRLMNPDKKEKYIFLVILNKNRESQTDYKYSFLRLGTFFLLAVNTLTDGYFLYANNMVIIYCLFAFCNFFCLLYGNFVLNFVCLFFDISLNLKDLEGIKDINEIPSNPEGVEFGPIEKKE